MKKENPAGSKATSEANPGCVLTTAVYQTAQSEAVVISISGAIDMFSISLIKDCAAKLLRENKNNLVMALEKATGIDAAGMGTLLNVSRKCHLAGGKLVLAGLPAYIKGLFKITQIPIPVYPSVKRALKELGVVLNPR